MLDSERKLRSKTASRTKTSMTGTVEVWPMIAGYAMIHAAGGDTGGLGEGGRHANTTAGALFRRS